MEATGERLIPVQQGDVAIEHLHRYAIARELAEGKVVLDIASGEGYGAHLMSHAAVKVFGVDACAEAVAHARYTYQRENLEYLQGSCTALPIADSSIELVVSFETLEHIHEHDQMLDEFLRVIRPDGSLLLSTPDRDVYTTKFHRDNPFHLRELNLEELRSLLGTRFRWLRIFRQRLVRGSLVVEEPNGQSSDGMSGFRTLRGDFSTVSTIPRLANAVYLIALASNVPISSTACSYFESGVVADDLLKTLAITQDRAMTLERQAAEAEQHVIALRSELERARATIDSLDDHIRAIKSSRFWRYSSAVRSGTHLGRRLMRAVLPSGSRGKSAN